MTTAATRNTPLWSKKHRVEWVIVWRRYTVTRRNRPAIAEHWEWALCNRHRKNTGGAGAVQYCLNFCFLFFIFFSNIRTRTEVKILHYRGMAQCCQTRSVCLWWLGVLLLILGPCTLMFAVHLILIVHHFDMSFHVPLCAYLAHAAFVLG